MNVEKSLADVSGDWTGSNKMRILPDSEYSDTAATAKVSLVAQGRSATIGYTWADDGKPQDGVLLITDGDEPGAVAAVWVDSWHQSPQWMVLDGSVDEHGVIRLKGSYAAGGWRIAVDPSDSDRLRLTMDNIYEDLDYQAVEATYERAR